MEKRNYDFADEASPLKKSRYIKRKEEQKNGIHITQIELLKDQAIYGKRKGLYVSLEIEDIEDKKQQKAWKKEIHSVFLELLKKHHFSKKDKVLVVGLGNDAYLSDALGPKTIEKIHATSHLKDAYLASSFVSVSTLLPGVTSKTGIESAHLIDALIQKENYTFVIVIDSLATSSIRRLYKVVQITDTGITPGSGVQNARKTIEASSFGCPVITLGVATVVESASFIHEILSQFEITTLTYEEIHRYLHEEKQNYIMTSKDIDRMIPLLANVLSEGIEKTLNPIFLEEER